MRLDPLAAHALADPLRSRPSRWSRATGSETGSPTGALPDAAAGTAGVVQREGDEAAEPPPDPGMLADQAELMELVRVLEAHRDEVVAAGVKRGDLDAGSFDELIQGLRDAARSGDAAEIARLNAATTREKERVYAEHKGDEAPAQRQTQPRDPRVVQGNGLLNALMAGGLVLALVLFVLAIRSHLRASPPPSRSRLQPPPPQTTTAISTTRAGTKSRRKDAPKQTPTAPQPSSSTSSDSDETHALDIRPGAFIDLEEITEARKAIAAYNRPLIAAYDLAVRAVAAYDHDRRQGFVPRPSGGHVQNNAMGGRTQPYQNLQGYFPGGQTYTEEDVNAGVAVAGNYRKITPSAPVGGARYWVGYNITHPGQNWIMAWTGHDWQVWDPANHTLSPVPSHTNTPPTSAQRRMARDGVTIRALNQESSFQSRVVERRHP